MSEPFIRPDARAYLAMMAARPRPAMNDENVAQMRQIPPEIMAEMVSALDLPVGEIGEIRDVTMPGPGLGPGGDMALRMFDPREQRGAGPVVVFYHGGGFVVGSIGSHAALAAEIARQLDLPVISVEYRLAPEHKWPAAPDDAEAAARWIAENGAAFGRDFTGLVLCGDSAGGTLTCVTALALRDRPAALPVLAQIPIYPKADSSRRYPSTEAFGQGYGLDATDMAYFDRAYAPDMTNWRHSAAVGNLAGVAPALVLTAGLDPLRDEGRAYAARMIEAGCDVTYREYAGTIHGCFTFRQVIPSAQADLIAAMALAREIIARSAG